MYKYVYTFMSCIGVYVYLHIAVAARLQFIHKCICMLVYMCIRIYVYVCHIQGKKHKTIANIYKDICV